MRADRKERAQHSHLHSLRHIDNRAESKEHCRGQESMSGKGEGWVLLPEGWVSMSLMALLASRCTPLAHARALLALQPSLGQRHPSPITPTLDVDVCCARRPNPTFLGTQFD